MQKDGEYRRKLLILIGTPSTQSLNQFAECMSNAETLCAEVVDIQGGSKGKAIPTILHRESEHRMERRRSRARMARI